MAHVSRAGEVTTGRGRTAVRIGWVEREGSFGWLARTSSERQGGFRRQYDAVVWLYSRQRAAGAARTYTIDERATGLAALEGDTDA